MHTLRTGLQGVGLMAAGTTRGAPGEICLLTTIAVVSAGEWRARSHATNGRDIFDELPFLTQQI